MLFLTKTRGNDNRENNWRETILKGLWAIWNRISCEIYFFRSTDEDMSSELPTLISKAMHEYQKAVKEEKEKQAKKEKQIEKK